MEGLRTSSKTTTTTIRKVAMPRTQPIVRRATLRSTQLQWIIKRVVATGPMSGTTMAHTIRHSHEVVGGPEAALIRHRGVGLAVGDQGISSRYSQVSISSSNSQQRVSEEEAIPVDVVVVEVVVADIRGTTISTGAMTVILVHKAVAEVTIITTKNSCTMNITTRRIPTKTAPRAVAVDEIVVGMETAAIIISQLINSIEGVGETGPVVGEIEE